MKTAIILHGTGSTPNDNWFPWLKGELESREFRVFVPQLPIGLGNQTLENWLKALQESVPELDRDAILIGHSNGAAFMCSLLNQKLSQPVRASYFVSGFYEDLNNPDFTDYIKTFVDLDFDWELIRKNAGKVAVFQGDDDPYVPMEEGVKLAHNLGVEPVVIVGGGHINGESGYIKFPQLLDEIVQP